MTTFLLGVLCGLASVIVRRVVKTIVARRRPDPEMYIVVMRPAPRPTRHDQTAGLN